jgi:hypothetical protein
LLRPLRIPALAVVWGWCSTSRRTKAWIGSPELGTPLSISQTSALIRPKELRFCRPGELGPVMSTYINIGEDQAFGWNIVPLSVYSTMSKIREIALFWVPN